MLALRVQRSAGPGAEGLGAAIRSEILRYDRRWKREGGGKSGYELKGRREWVLACGTPWHFCQRLFTRGSVGDGSSCFAPALLHFIIELCCKARQACKTVRSLLMYAQADWATSKPVHPDSAWQAPGIQLVPCASAASSKQCTMCQMTVC